MTIVLALALVATIDVRSPPECVAGQSILDAIDEDGGVDPAERVHVDVEPTFDDHVGADPYSAVIDIELIGAPAVHRVTSLREVECKDVPELVVVLIDAQRRAAAEAKAARSASHPLLVEEREAPRPRSSPWPDRRRRTAPIDLGERYSWSPCDGPPSVGPAGLNVGAGLALPFGARLSMDGSYALMDHVALVGGVEGLGGSSSVGATFSTGVAFNTKVEIFDVSVRGLLGAGGGVGERTIGIVEEPTGGSKFVSGVGAGVYFAPQAAVRLRYGWLYGEVGGTWRIGLDPTPAVTLSMGMVMLAPNPTTPSSSSE